MIKKKEFLKEKRKNNQDSDDEQLDTKYVREHINSIVCL